MNAQHMSELYHASDYGRDFCSHQTLAISEAPCKKLANEPRSLDGRLVQSSSATNHNTF